MTLLSPRLQQVFGDDEHPEQTLAQLLPIDQAWVQHLTAAGAEDPGVMSYPEWSRLGPDDRQRCLYALEHWYSSWPFVRTAQVREIERYLTTLPAPRGSDLPGVDPRESLEPPNPGDLLDAPVITGAPGTGKTTVLRRAAVSAMLRLARQRRLKGASQRDAEDALVLPDWRPVIFHSTDGNPRTKVFFAHLCDELAIPPTSDPQAAFQRAVARHGVQYVFIDEIQMINFDGQFGMYLHNAIKALQNMNLRVVLSGHNVRHLLTNRQTAAQNATQTQSIARWAFQDLERYPHENEADVGEWRRLLAGLEQHIRLSGHEQGATVLSVDFEEHLWVSTLGYVNALAALVTGVCLTASRTRSQQITAKIIDSIRLNERVARGRNRRLEDWRAGRLNWATDAAVTS